MVVSGVSLRRADQEEFHFLIHRSHLFILTCLILIHGCSVFVAVDHQNGQPLYCLMFIQPMESSVCYPKEWAMTDNYPILYLLARISAKQRLIS